MVFLHVFFLPPEVGLLLSLNYMSPDIFCENTRLPPGMRRTLVVHGDLRIGVDSFDF